MRIRFPTASHFDSPWARTVPAAGRDIGVYEFGDPDGDPVIALHGTPACGAGFDWTDVPARARAAGDRARPSGHRPIDARPHGERSRLRERARRARRRAGDRPVRRARLLGGRALRARGRARARRTRARLGGGRGRGRDRRVGDPRRPVAQRPPDHLALGARAPGRARSCSARPTSRHASLHASRCGRSAPSWRRTIARCSASSARPGSRSRLFTQALARSSAGVVDDYAAPRGALGHPARRDHGTRALLARDRRHAGAARPHRGARRTAAQRASRRRGRARATSG